MTMVYTTLSFLMMMMVMGINIGKKEDAHNNDSGQMPSNWCMHSLLRIRIMMIMIMIMMVMIMIMIMMIMLKLMVISSMRWGVLQRFSAIHFFLVVTFLLFIPKKLLLGPSADKRVEESRM